MPASRRTVVRGGLVKFRQRVLRARTGPRTGHVARRGLPWRWRCEHFPPSLPLFPPSLPVFPSSLPLLISFLSPPLLVPQARMRLLLLPPYLGQGLLAFYPLPLPPRSLRLHALPLPLVSCRSCMQGRQLTRCSLQLLCPRPSFCTLPLPLSFLFALTPRPQWPMNVRTVAWSARTDSKKSAPYCIYYIKSLRVL